MLIDLDKHLLYNNLIENGCQEGYYFKRLVGPVDNRRVPEVKAQNRPGSKSFFLIPDPKGGGRPKGIEG